MRCDQCGNFFRSQESLGSHIRLTHKRVNLCELCGRASKTIQNHLYHMWSAHNIILEGAKVYNCRHCDKAIFGKSHWQSHERAHSGVTCEICGKSFKQERSMKRHVEAHSGLKPYICQYCGRGFAQKSARESHERTHTGEKPFQCQICMAQFTQSGTLRIHEKKHHPDMAQTSSAARRYPKI